MKNEIYDNMLFAYDITTEQQRRNAIFEVNQQVILAGLYNGGFFDVAAFYGGTCLRIFHGLQRFSEDMDFSLLAPDDKFDFSKFFQPIIDEFAIVGREVEIRKKTKFFHDTLFHFAGFVCRKNARIGVQGLEKQSERP